MHCINHQQHQTFTKASEGSDVDEYIDKNSTRDTLAAFAVTVGDDTNARSFVDTTAKFIICKSKLQLWMTKGEIEREAERASYGFNNSCVTL